MAKDIDFGPHFLDHIIYNCIDNTQFLRTVKQMIDLSLFKTRERKNLIKILFDYYDEYNKAPGDLFYEIMDDLKDNIGGSKYVKVYDLACDILQMSNSNPEYVLSKLKKAIDVITFQNCIIEAAELVAAKKLEEAKSVVLKGITKSDIAAADYYDFFDDSEYIKQRSQGKSYKMKTNSDSIDKAIGGFNPSWLIIYLAATKGGKTAKMIEDAVSASMQGLNVLFVSLEMSKEQIEVRLDQAIGFLGTEPYSPVDTMEYNSETGRWEKTTKVIRTVYDVDVVGKNRRTMKKQGGRIVISDRSSNKFNYRDLNVLLDKIFEEKGIIFDVVIIDYLGEMGPIEKGQSKKERIAENTSGLKATAKDRNLIMITGQQGNREAMQSPVFNPSNISDAIEPVFIADLVMAICQTKKEEALNMYRMFIALFRHGPKGAMIPLYRDLSIGQMSLGDAYFLENELEEGEEDSSEYKPKSKKGKKSYY